MISQKIQALFDFIDFLDSNKTEYIEKWIPLCNELKTLDKQIYELKPNRNYKDKQQYDNIQNQIKEKFVPISGNVYAPITGKLRELEIWSGDDTMASMWNNNISAISDFTRNFSENDIEQVMRYKQKYLNFRKETNTDFYCLSLVFSCLDEILKSLFDFFKDTDENEFDSFEAKTIEVNSREEFAKKVIENIGENVKFSIPFDLHKSQTQTTTNIPHEVIMGDKIQVGNISNNSGQISIGGKGNKTEVNNKDDSSKKSLCWQIIGVIITAVLAVAGIIVSIIFG